MYATITIPDGAETRAANGDVVGNGVRLRNAPSTSAAILELMYDGENVLIDFQKTYSVTNNGFFYVQREKTGTWGWVKSSYICPWD